MIFLPLLTATVFAVGGPRPHHPEPPSIFGNATVRVFDKQNRQVAESTFGNLAVRVPQGFYRVVASMEPPVLNQTQTCGQRVVFIGKRTRRARTTFVCSIR